jgi:thiopeptide-type bacteriocin biosynthesis protein
MDLGFVLRALERQIQIDKQHQLIKDYEGGVYNRELERYGTDIISEVEDFFCVGSDLAIAFIKIIKSGCLAISAFQLAIWNVYLMVCNALRDANTQIAFLKHNSEIFLTEFHADKQLKVDLDKKYRELLPDINRVLGSEYLTIEHATDLQQSIDQLLDKWTLITDLVKDKNRLIVLLTDLIHMQVNRLFTSDQRKYEMLIYYSLFKYVSSQVARAKKQAAPDLYLDIQC